jgi:hypothetical protein
MVAVWANNAIMKMLSNYHGAVILEAENGLMQRAMDKSGKRAMRQKAVPCPAQTREYCQTFHLIDKGNGKEVKYDMARKRRLHNWVPNLYVVYKELVIREGGKSLLMGQAVRELVHSLCQWGAPTWNRVATHLAHLHNMD